MYGSLERLPVLSSRECITVLGPFEEGFSGDYGHVFADGGGGVCAKESFLGIAVVSLVASLSRQ